MITLLTGCSTNDKKLSAHKKAEQMFSRPYVAECIAKVISNKTENEYSYTCEKTEDGLIKLDYGDISFTLTDDNAVISNSDDSIKACVTTGNLWLVPQSYFDACLDRGTFEETENGCAYEAAVDGNSYRCNVRIEFDKKFTPVKMTVSDDKNKDSVQIHIKKFSLK